MTPDFERAAAGMCGLPQWFVWRLEWDAREGKFSKTPWREGAGAIGADNPINWMSYEAARAEVQRLGGSGSIRYTLGFWLTADCGWWFLDIDLRKCQLGPYKSTDFADGLVHAYQGAFVEWSSSQKGLHIIGRGEVVPHRSKPERPMAARLAPLELEFYSQGRGIAFGLDGQAWGSAETVCNVLPLLAQYFPPNVALERDHGLAVGGFKGSDDELITRALNARRSAAVAFDGAPSFGDLWSGAPEHNSHNDAALIAHLAFWCGPDEGRIERLMRRSGLVRPKWDERRPSGTYLTHSIAEIVAKCATFYSEPEQSLPTAGEDGAASATSDLANARRLVITQGQDLMHVPGVGWHVWGGNGPWQHDDGQAQRLAFGLGRVIQAEADALEEWVSDQSVFDANEMKRRADYQKTLRRWARSSEFVVSVRHTLEAAQTMLTVTADELDANPLLVGTPSGVIDLTTGAQREHRREDRITKHIAVDYDPNAKAPTWSRFVDRIMGGNRELADYLQTVCGYMLSGKRGEHALPVFYGSGQNGKSTFLGTVQAVMGDYAGTASPGLLLARKGDGDQLAAIAALRGLRLVIASESGETERLDESRVKQITGGDRLTGRPLYQNFVEFTPSHLVILQTNHRPRVNGTDEGIWRRLKLIPFAVSIPPEERDTELPQKLRAEFAGILAWCVEGWRMYQRQGFREPEAVKLATAEYRSASDVLGRFLEERCNLGPELSVSSGGLYNFYRAWCGENGEHVMTNKAFSLRLSERPGLIKTKHPSGMTWRGLGVASHVEIGHMGGKVIPMPQRG